MSGTHVLYRFYTSTGQLLYVGITMDPSKRFKKHGESKAWWSEVAGITLEHHSTREGLARAEQRAIRIEKPRHNIVHNAARIQEDLDELPGGWKNPTGVVTFDDGDLAKLAGWQELTQVMNQLYLELGQSGVRIFRGDLFNQDVHAWFVAAMERLARSIFYMDACPECPAEIPWMKKAVAPHHATVPGGSMCAHYRCAAGHEWSRWHTIRTLFFEQFLDREPTSNSELRPI